MLRTSTNLRLISQGYMSIRKLSIEVTNGNTSSSTKSINPNVEGLSKKVVNVPNQPVGPGASKDKEYKNPEYFCYNVMSFAEAEVEMEKFRLPTPSNKKKFDM